ncbi:hypothetical protein EA762_15445 [Acinetobacter pittii]|nr:hypothetical protein EA762_15445 [Acinetobacter pittii]
MIRLDIYDHFHKRYIFNESIDSKSIVMRVSHFVLWVFQAVFVIKDSFFYGDLISRKVMNDSVV